MAFFLRVTVMVLAVIGLTSADCPPLWTRFRHNCYRFMGQEMSWTDAENHCREFFTISGQGHLASHSSDEENFVIMYVKSSFISADDKHVWIGLTDQSNEGTFIWSDGRALDYNEGWKPREPNNAGSGEDCVEIWYDLTYGPVKNDRPCSNLYSHVCKMSIDVNGCF
ncbi:alpha-N-acetylgalactosamine-specific lectin-like [Asterias amurensis]|uniref:alpha-N-acetylgalactosamine-specific lectin-like n=1 Tax=Asterias amurensis TaxID=7602 RepID=UPI003AB21D1B